MGQIQSRMAHKVSSQLPQNTGRAALKREKRIPEYLEADEINAIIRAASSPKTKLLMLEQWRACLRGPGHRSAESVAGYNQPNAQSKPPL